MGRLRIPRIRVLARYFGLYRARSQDGTDNNLQRPADNRPEGAAGDGQNNDNPKGDNK